MKRWRVFALAVAAVLLVFGCNGLQNGDQGEPGAGENAGTLVMSGTGQEWRTSGAPDGSGQEQGREGELTVFDINAGENRFDDRIAREIMERTGVRIRVMDPTDDTGQKVNLMRSFRDYPDMILIGIGSIEKYQAGGCLVDLEPYMDRLPNVREMYGDMLDRYRTPDGRLYYLGNWYGRDEDAVSGFQMRYDYLCQLVGEERADSDEPFTQEEFLELLREFKRQFPEIGGQESIPFSLCMDISYKTPLYGMFGMKEYYEREGRLFHLARDPRYGDMVEFLNQMYREGLLDKEWMLNRRKLFSEKTVSGRVFATACAYWDMNEETVALKEKYGEDAVFYSYKVLGQGVDETQTTYSGRGYTGWDAIAVTDNCQDLDAALRVIDFLASEEGQYLMLWGIQGEDWDLTDGVHTPRPEMVEAFTGDMEKTQRDTAVRRWTWFVKNGTGSDGTPYDLMTKYVISEQSRIINRRMNDNDIWDSSIYVGLEPRSGTQEALIWKNVGDIYSKAWPRMVDAATRDECVAIREKMLRDMEAEGLARAEEEISRNYAERRALWGV